MGKFYCVGALDTCNDGNRVALFRTRQQARDKLKDLKGSDYASKTPFYSMAKVVRVNVRIQVTIDRTRRT
jgi:hypothetical protein